MSNIVFYVDESGDLGIEIRCTLPSRWVKQIFNNFGSVMPAR